jgi:hypothetical protein
MLHIAATQPATFLGIAARLIPQQVQMDLHAVLPGNLSPTTGPIFGSFFRPSSRPFQMLLIVHPEPYFSMSWPSCKTDHFLVFYAISRPLGGQEMSAKVMPLHQAKIIRNATSRSQGRQGNDTYRVRE